MTNAQWKAMLARNGELKPRLTRAEQREMEKAWNAQCERFERRWIERSMEEGFEDRLSRMRDQMNADISREMGGYYGSNEDL